jgi:hypothetical protein
MFAKSAVKIGEELINSPSSTPNKSATTKNSDGGQGRSSSVLKAAFMPSKSKLGSSSTGFKALKNKGFLRQALKLKLKVKETRVKLAGKQGGDCPFMKDHSNEDNHTCMLCGRGLQEHVIKTSRSVTTRVQVLQQEKETLEVFRISPTTASSMGGSVVDIFGKGFSLDSTINNKIESSAFAKFGSTLTLPLEIVSTTRMRCIVPRRRSHFATVLVSVTLDKGKTWSKNHISFTYKGVVPLDSIGSLVTCKYPIIFQPRV